MTHMRFTVYSYSICRTSTLNYSKFSRKKLTFPIKAHNIFLTNMACYSIQQYKLTFTNPNINRAMRGTT